MPIQICRPISDGNLQRTGSEGFYRGSGENTNYSAGPPYWSSVDDITPDDSGTWLAWAVENDNNIGCGISFDVTQFEGGINDTINYVTVYFRAHPGQSGGNNITPTGNGNYFNLGLYYRSTGYEQTLAESFLSPITTTWKTFVVTFTTNYLGENFTGADFIGTNRIQPMFSYGRYWVTTDKDYVINDNAHNLTSQIYMEISYEPFVNTFGAGLLL